MTNMQDLIRDTAIGCPEQFLAVEKLLAAAAESCRSADLIEDEDPAFGDELHQHADRCDELARKLLDRIAPDEITAGVLHDELKHRARV